MRSSAPVIDQHSAHYLPETLSGIEVIHNRAANQRFLDIDRPAKYAFACVSVRSSSKECSLHTSHRGGSSRSAYTVSQRVHKKNRRQGILCCKREYGITTAVNWVWLDAVYADTGDSHYVVGRESQQLSRRLP